jgi:hypothetical protein
MIDQAMLPRRRRDGRWICAFEVILFVIFCSIPSEPQAAATGKAIFNIADYGAKNDASEPATDAFRKAIEAAKAAGGGTVYVPPGRYTCGAIELFSNMTLEIDAGAIVAFPATTLPFTKGRQQGIEALTPVPLIGGHDLEMSPSPAAAFSPATMPTG